MASTYEPIATYTIPSPQASYTFTGISSSYTDLVLVGDYSFTAGTNYTVAQVGNGSIDTGSNYSFTVINGNGTSAVSYRDSNKTYFQLDTGLTGSARAMSIVNFQNYSNTTTYKTIMGRTSAAGSLVSAYVNLWRSTLVINQIKVYDFSGNNLSTGSTFTLYGIKAA
jgi:hypothetical protein